MLPGHYDGNSHPGHDDFRVEFVFKCLDQSGGERHQRLAGAGLTEQRDKVDLRIHQQVHREVLFAIAHIDAPHGIFRIGEVTDGFKHGGLAGDLAHHGMQRLFAVLVDEFVDQKLWAKRSADKVEGATVLFPGLHVLAVQIPEIVRQRANAGVQEVGVFEDLVVEIVLGGESERMRLDAHVDVLGHQDDLALRDFLLQVHHHADDLVVGLAYGQVGGQVSADGLGLQEQVPGGGVALTSRSIGLILAPEHRSISLSKRIGDCINRRFNAVIRGAKRGVATPKTDRFLELEIPPRYADNLPRYIRVVRSIALVEPPGGRHLRLELLARQLADPVTAPAAALRLEAIGKDATSTLKKGLASKDAEVRFASAEALAYLGESVAATHLAAVATNLRSARPAALTALGVLDDANGIDALQTLLSSASAETRYGAFRSLWKMNHSLPLVRGERLGDACFLHVLDVKGPPLVHLTRSHRPEIVLFGVEHPLADGLRAEAGSSIVVVVDDAIATVSCFAVGKPDQQLEVPARVDTVTRAIIDIGGSYPDVVQFLQQATSSHCLQSRLAFDAVPNDADGRMGIHEEAALKDRAVIDGDDADDAEANIESGTDTAVYGLGVDEPS